MIRPERSAFVEAQPDLELRNTFVSVETPGLGAISTLDMTASELAAAEKKAKTVWVFGFGTPK